MKNVFKPASLILYFLAFVVFTIGGMVFAARTGAAEGQGLAGGAIVLFNGLIGGLIGLFLSFFLARSENRSLVIRVNRVLFAMLVLIWVFFFIRGKYITNDSGTSSMMILDEIPLVHSSFGLTKSPNLVNKPDMGMGFFKPDFYDQKVLYFHGPPKEDSRHDLPYDSITFKTTQYGQYEITYGPPFLVPAHLKMDYEIFYLTVVTLHRDWAELVVNRTNGQTAWVSLSQGEVTLWPDFLLNIFSVEFKDVGSKVFYKPMSLSSTVNQPFSFLRPLMIRSDWMKVNLMDEDFKEVGEGWIRWRDGAELLISYNLLS